MAAVDRARTPTRSLEAQVAEPGPAAQHTGVAITTILIEPSAAVIGCTRVGVVPSIYDQLSEVAVHVVQPPGIRREARDRNGTVVRPLAAAIRAVG